jgi:hypothetical protein
MKINRNLTLGAFLALGAIACAQGVTKGTEPISTAMKEEAIHSFVSLFRENYVFPDVADRASKILEQHLANHDYDSLTEGDAFAHLVTQQLKEVCKDAHLRFGYSAEVLPARKQKEAPSPEELKQRKHDEQFLNAGYERVDRLPGNIGYLEVRSFDSPDAVTEPLKGAMELLANTDALILDLRRNGGGSPESVQMLCSYFFGQEPVHLNDLYDRKGKILFSSWTSKHVSAKRYLNREIYVLTSKRTGSGAEECAYDLQCLKRATIVGEPTWGGANPGGSYRLSDHFRAFIPSGRAENPYTKKNWEGVGVLPDVAVAPADGLKTAHLLALKHLLNDSKKAEDKDRYRQTMEDIDAGTIKE